MKKFSTLFLDSDDFFITTNEEPLDVLTEAEGDETEEEPSVTPEETPSEEIPEDDTIDTTDETEVEDDSTNTGDGEEEPVTPKDAGAKYLLYKNFKSLHNLVLSLNDKVVKTKDLIESDNKHKDMYETIDFIEDRLDILKENLKLILSDRILEMEYTKAKTLFIYSKSEVSLLVSLFDRISSKIE